jgi:hypothetical protein
LLLHILTQKHLFPSISTNLCTPKTSNFVFVEKKLLKMFGSKETLARQQKSICKEWALCSRKKCRMFLNRGELACVWWKCRAKKTWDGTWFKDYEESWGKWGK